MPAAIPLAIVAAGVGGAAIAANGAKSAAKTQADAANAANQTQQNMFNQIQGNEAGYIQTGNQANAAEASYYGLPGSAPFNQSTLENLPGYQFQLQQGTKAVDQNLAARGLFGSGAAAKALTNYGQGLAQNYGAMYASGLDSLSRQGQAGAAGVAAAGMNSANQQGANDIYAGNAQAAGTANYANALGFGLSGLAQGSGYAYNSAYGPYGTAGLSPYTPQSQPYGTGLAPYTPVSQMYGDTVMP